VTTTAQNYSISQECIWQMLQYIPAHDYEDWWRIGMALKAHVGDAGWPLFDDWSQTATNYKASKARSAWQSYRGSGVGIGTLVYMAKQNGWHRSAPTKPAPAPRQAPKPQQSNTAHYAAELWSASDKWMQANDWLAHPSPDELLITHTYAVAKGISTAGGAARGIASGSIIGKNTDTIIVPVREHGIGKVLAVQCISNQCIDGKWSKQNFGSLLGGYLLLGNTLDKDIPWYVAEGWSSAYSVVFHHQKKSGVCACAFGKGRIKKVAEYISTYHNPSEIIRLWEQTNEYS
jgi:putative DNA primase/helicase